LGGWGLSKSSTLLDLRVGGVGKASREELPCEKLFCLLLIGDVGLLSGVSVKTAEEDESLEERNELFLEGGFGAKDDDELDLLSFS
jgi:hypothetical protein